MPSGDIALTRRTANSKALAAFGVSTAAKGNGLLRTIRDGDGPTVYTVGYEKRDAEGLLAVLVDAGIDVLVDIRERPVSRNRQFSAGALAACCEETGVGYESWTALGSTEHQRDMLRETGDCAEFRKRFRDLVVRGRDEEMLRLARLAKRKTIALLCYERAHEECHRCIVSELLAESIDATVVAIL